MSDDLLARPQPFYSPDRVEQRLRDEIERLRAEVGKLRVQRAGEDVRLADAISERDRLRAELRGLCEARDQARRTSEYWKAEHNAANEAIAALRKRVEEARVVNTVVEYANGEKMVWLEDDCMPLDSEGKRVALVVLD